MERCKHKDLCRDRLIKQGRTCVPEKCGDFEKFIPEPRTTISEFLNTKTITEQDLKDNFNFVRMLRVDMSTHKGCPNCNNELNFYRYPAEPWTQVNRCFSCNTIMITHILDRMGGGSLDTVDIYEEK